MKQVCLKTGQSVLSHLSENSPLLKGWTFVQSSPQYGYHPKNRTYAIVSVVLWTLTSIFYEVVFFKIASIEGFYSFNMGALDFEIPLRLCGVVMGCFILMIVAVWVEFFSFRRLLFIVSGFIVGSLFLLPFSSNVRILSLAVVFHDIGGVLNIATVVAVFTIITKDTLHSHWQRLLFIIAMAGGGVGAALLGSYFSRLIAGLYQEGITSSVFLSMFSTGAFFLTYGIITQRRRIEHEMVGGFDSLSEIASVRSDAIAAMHKDLSGRELEVLQLLLQGYTAKRIANKLRISINTVRTHIRNIYKKIGISSKDQLTALADTVAFIE